MKKHKIVIVEDDTVALEILAAVLVRKFKDIEVFTATNGKEGLGVFKDQLPELLLTDIKMPEMDGVQLAREVREHYPETVIIMISADSGETSFKDPDNSGLKVDYFITKPVDYSKLFSAVEESLLKLD